MRESHEFNKLPKGWEWTTLDEVAKKVTDGSHYTPKYYLEGYPFITITDIKNDTIDFESAKLIGKNDYEKLKNNCNPHRGDILFSKDGTVGKVLEINFEKEFIVLSSLAIIRLFTAFSYAGYFKYLLQSKLVLDQASQLKTGTALTRVILRNLRSVKLPLPPLPEQHRIVASIEELFSRLDAGVEALQKAKAQLSRYRQAVLKAAVEGKLTEEWRKAHHEVEPAETINQIDPAILSKLPKLPESWNWFYFSQLINYSQNGISKRRSEEGDPVHVLRLADIVEYKIFPKNPRDIRLTKDEVNKYVIQEGDLLCIRVNGSKNLVGRMIPFNSNDKWAFCDHFIRFKLNKKLVFPSYLSNYFSTQIARNYIEFNMVSSAGQNTISQKTLASLPVPLPCMAEQEAIVSEIDRMSSISEAVGITSAESFKLADRLRHSILKRAFEGKLVPQDPNDEPASILLERIKAERAMDNSKIKNNLNSKQMRLIDVQ